MAHGFLQRLSAGNERHPPAWPLPCIAPIPMNSAHPSPSAFQTAPTHLDFLLIAHAAALQLSRACRAFPPDDGMGLSREVRRTVREVIRALARALDAKATWDLSRSLTYAESTLVEAEALGFVSHQTGLVLEASFRTYAEALAKVSKALRAIRLNGPRSLREQGGR